MAPRATDEDESRPEPARRLRSMARKESSTAFQAVPRRGAAFQIMADRQDGGATSAAE
jgi:hypothetical protein